MYPFRFNLFCLAGEQFGNITIWSRDLARSVSKQSVLAKFFKDGPEQGGKPGVFWFSLIFSQKAVR